MKRTDRIAAILALVAALAAPAHVGAQDVEEAGGSLLSAAIGTGAGLIGGGYANLAVVVLKARVGHYQHDDDPAGTTTAAAVRIPLVRLRF